MFVGQVLESQVLSRGRGGCARVGQRLIAALGVAWQRQRTGQKRCQKNSQDDTVCRAYSGSEHSQTSMARQPSWAPFQAVEHKKTPDQVNAGRKPMEFGPQLGNGFCTLAGFSHSEPYATKMGSFARVVWM